MSTASLPEAGPALLKAVAAISGATVLMSVPTGCMYRSMLLALNDAFSTRRWVLSLVSGLLYGSAISATVLSVADAGSATIVYLVPRWVSIGTLPMVSAPL